MRFITMVKRNFLTIIVAALTVVSLSGGVFAQQKAPATPAAPVVKKTKKMPARDPKTGKFIKSGTAAKAPVTTVAKPKTKKALPPRDPKTGKFMKKTTVAPPTTPAKP